MEHADIPGLLEILTDVYTNLGFELVSIQHRDWNDDTCIFNLRDRERFISKMLEHLDDLTIDCGSCMMYRLLEFSATTRTTLEFFGITEKDRFGNVLNIAIQRALEPYDDKISSLLTGN